MAILAPVVVHVLQGILPVHMLACFLLAITVHCIMILRHRTARVQSASIFLQMTLCCLAETVATPLLPY